LPPVQHDITDLRFFLTITESGSLAEAARRLDVTPSAVSQRLRHLEMRLGMPLAHRSTRRFVLTEEGELFREGVGSVLEQLDRVIESLRERSGEVSGTLNVGGPLGFGRRFLAGAIAEFQGLHPGLKVALTLSDVVGPADANRFDLIVHIGKMADSSVVAHPLGPNHRFICAAPSYLARRPRTRRSSPRTIASCCARTTRTSRCGAFASAAARSPCACRPC
jgi:DNA-binding transcriptional LysR family regulator